MAIKVFEGLESVTPSGYINDEEDKGAIYISNFGTVAPYTFQGNWPDMIWMLENRHITADEVNARLETICD